MSFYYPQAVLTIKVRWEKFSREANSILDQDYEFSVIPKRISVEINDYTSADTFNATLDYKSFPFDPRTIRAMGVTVHIQDMKSLYIGQSTKNIIKPTQENAIFQGFIDEEAIKFDDNSRTISIEGRDFTSLLLDAPYKGNALDLGKPIDVLVNDLLQELEATRQIKVDNRTGGSLPIVSSYASDLTALGKSRSGKKKEKYWDVITEVVGRAALIAYIELDKLVITKPRVLYSDSQPYQFIYGRNLKELGFKRKLGRQKGINICVRSLNFRTKEVIEAKIPLDADESWAASLSIQAEEQKIEKLDAQGQIKEETAPYITFNLPNMPNKEALIEKGQSIFEEIGRQQLDGEMTTKEMLLKDVNGIEYDILKIRNGTPIKIEIDQGDLKGISRVSTKAEKEAFLIQRKYPVAIASALAETLGKFETRFYTRSVTFSLDYDGGFEMKLDFVNFIETGNKSL